MCSGAEIWWHVEEEAGWAERVGWLVRWWWVVVVLLRPGASGEGRSAAPHTGGRFEVEAGSLGRSSWNGCIVYKPGVSHRILSFVVCGGVEDVSAGKAHTMGREGLENWEWTRGGCNGRERIG